MPSQEINACIDPARPVLFTLFFKSGYRSIAAYLNAPKAPGVGDLSQQQARLGAASIMPHAKFLKVRLAIRVAVHHQDGI
jgi:hypothetical protein